tara:strand:- start:434 stop:547 length:114 start_codon:yes stop_codon:yes gene_type:complete
MLSFLYTIRLLCKKVEAQNQIQEQQGFPHLLGLQFVD